MFLRFLLSAAAMTTIVSMNGAQACDFCLISQGLSPLETVRGAGLRVNERYSRLDRVFQGTHELDSAGIHEDFWTTEVSGFYSFSERFLLLATFPIRHTHVHGEVATGADGDAEFEASNGGGTGIGDFSLLGRYTVFQHHTLQSTSLVALNLGLKFPTGSTNGKDDAGNFLDSHLQLGTGSTDVLLGVGANHVINRFTLSANFLASLPTEGEFGRTSHTFGNSLNYDVTAKYRVSSATPATAPTQWFVSFGVNGEWRGREDEDGVTVGDSGGHVLYVTPGIQVIVGRKWIVEASYQAAVQHDLNGTQKGESYKVAGSLTYLF